MNDAPDRARKLKAHEQKRERERADKARKWNGWQSGAMNDHLWYKHLPAHLRDGPEGNAEGVEASK